MARVTLTPIAVPAAYATAAVAIVWTAADVALKNQFVGTGREIVLVQNADAGATHTVIITSVADPYNRTGDITQIVAISTFMTFFIVPITGFLQTDGFVYLEGDNANLKFAILRLP